MTYLIMLFMIGCPYLREDEFFNVFFFQIALNMLREEGVASFYYGLGPSLIGIAPYIAVNFCIFDL